MTTIWLVLIITVSIVSCLYICAFLLHHNRVQIECTERDTNEDVSPVWIYTDISIVSLEFATIFRISSGYSISVKIWMAPSIREIPFSIL